MNQDEAKAEVKRMEEDLGRNQGLCPSCAANGFHRPTCQWRARYDGLRNFALNGPDPTPLTGPTLSWGEPCGTYVLEFLPDGVLLYFRRVQDFGGIVEIKIPMTHAAAAEMKSLLNTVRLTGEDHGIAGNC